MDVRIYREQQYYIEGNHNFDEYVKLWVRE